MAGLSSLLSNFGINRIDNRKGTLILLAVLCVLAALAVVMAISGKTDYGILFSDMVESDAAVVIEKLKELDIPYKLSADGKILQVPVENVPELRISFAADGLPQGGGVGYEIFDRSSFGQSDFTQRINYMRARQGELERAIRALSPVASAKVILQIPEDSIYVDELSKQPSASVVVKLHANAQFTRAEVRGIKHLVASSVAGMTSDFVTVVDTTGRILSDALEGGAQGESGVAGEALTAQASYERKLQADIASMLEHVLGPERAVVRVRVEMNMDELERLSQTYDPLPGTQEGVVSNRSEVKQAEGSLGPEGTAGLDAELGGTDGTGTASRSEVVTNFEVSRTEERLTRRAGAIKRVSVSVLLDNVEPARLFSIRQAVSAAAGLSPERGDSLTVESLEFSVLEEAEQTATKPAAKPGVPAMQPLVLYAGAGAGVVLLLFLVVASRLRRKRRAAQQAKELEEAAAAATSPIAPEMMAELAVREAAAAVEGASQTVKPKRIREPEIDDGEPSLLDEIKDQIRRDPVGASLIIRTWLNEED